MTADELLALPRGRARHELIRGQLHTMPLATWEEACLASTANRSLAKHVLRFGLGEVVVSTGFQLTSGPDTVRAPDVAFVRAERLLEADPERGYYPEHQTWPSR